MKARRYGVALFVCLVQIGIARGGDDASQPAYSGGWLTGTNGGTQFLSWSLIATGVPANSAFFIGNSNSNAAGAGPGINSGAGVAWGMFANGSNAAIATRPFVSALPVGQTFGVQMDNGFVDTSSSAGFSLADNLGVVRFSFRFVGGASAYSISDGSGTFNTTLPFSGTGLNIAVDLLNPTGYQFTVTDIASATQYQHVGPLVSGNPIDRFIGFSVNAGNNPANAVYFNRMAIAPVPEPASVLAICGLGGAAITGIRRWRKSSKPVD